MIFPCATCRAPVDPRRPERFFQVFVCTKRAGLEHNEEQFFCSARCLGLADFLVNPPHPQADPAAPPAPIVAAVQPEQAGQRDRLDTDLLLARARITRLEQRLDQHQAAGNALAERLAALEARPAVPRVDVVVRQGEGY